MWRLGLRGAVCRVDGEAIAAEDVAIRHLHEPVEIVFAHLVRKLLGPGRVVLVAEDAACILAGSAIVHRAGGRVREASAPGAGLDDSAAWPYAQSLDDIAVVGRIDDLGAVRQRDGPAFWCEGE